MLKKNSSNFSVFGNPIHHTKSPYIHELFSKQTGIIYNYDSTLVPLNKFFEYMIQFFSHKGIGANITIPFKEKAFLMSDKLTYAAKVSRSVNTFKKLQDGKILGDNTDGKGILYDLIRLKFIKKNDTVLVIGSGGAARGIIFSLLLYGCYVFILNRTMSRALNLVESFKKFGSISIFQHTKRKDEPFDIVINAIANIETSSLWNSIEFLIDKKTYFYDINYSINQRTFFLKWCIDRGVLIFSDGIGMLVSQAAYSFYLWHNIFPDIESVILKLQDG
ncbi:MAG: shikimate dehydrogenase [Buchnera aphidicola (Nurudea yanoniella)]